MKLAQFLTILVVACAATYWYATDRNKEAHADAKAQARTKERMADWVMVVKDKEIAPGQRLQLVRIASPIGDIMDTYCFLYTDAKTSQFVCPADTGHQEFNQ